jgi:NAD-dependent dihydropyrimidine dehydrogenase PreA subunit
MSKLWYPVINQSKCIGCMACYDMCKHGVFTIENDKPKVIYREGCVEGCHGCGNQCPQGAIVYSGDFKSAIKCACNCDGKED